MVVKLLSHFPHPINARTCSAGKRGSTAAGLVSPLFELAKRVIALPIIKVCNSSG
jgi:hypothetical protein